MTRFHLNRRYKQSLVLLITVFILINIFKYSDDSELIDCHNDWLNVSDTEFYFGDNIDGYPINIVPNIVHYILFTVHEIQFSHFISILSVLRNQRPTQIYIHCDCQQLSGEYYTRVLNIAKQLKIEFIVRYVERPTEVFGQPFNEEWINWHSSDVTRIRVLREYGGIYLDRDIYVVKSLDVFLKYEMTVNWDENDSITNAVFIGHKDAKFLRLWYNSYHNYYSSRWTYNSGSVPTRMLEKCPNLIHRVRDGFATGHPICRKVYTLYYKDWRKDFYTIHMYIRGNEVVFCRSVVSLDMIYEHNVTQLEVTFGEMTRELFEFENQFNN